MDSMSPTFTPASPSPPSSPPVHMHWSQMAVPHGLPTPDSDEVARWLAARDNVPSPEVTIKRDDEDTPSPGPSSPPPAASSPGVFVKEEGTPTPGPSSPPPYALSSPYPPIKKEEPSSPAWPPEHWSPMAVPHGLASPSPAELDDWLARANASSPEFVTGHEPTPFSGFVIGHEPTPFSGFVIGHEPTPFSGFVIGHEPMPFSGPGNQPPLTPSESGRSSKRSWDDDDDEEEEEEEEEFRPGKRARRSGTVEDEGSENAELRGENAELRASIEVLEQQLLGSQTLTKLHMASGEVGKEENERLKRRVEDGEKELEEAKKELEEAQKRLKKLERLFVKMGDVFETWE